METLAQAAERRFAENEGKTVDEIIAARKAEWLVENKPHVCVAVDVEEKAPVAAPTGFWRIALAVLVGNLLTGIIGALVYGMLR